MATFINMGFLNDSGIDAVVQTAEHIAPIIKERTGDAAAAAFDESFKSMYEEENYHKIFNLLIENGGLLFEVIGEANDRPAKEREAEGYFTVLISLLMQMEDEASLTETTEKLCETFGAETESPELRLKLFMMLYNTFQPSFPLRYPVYEKTLRFAAKAKCFDAMLPYLERLDEWLADWSLNAGQKRDLFLLISQKLRELGRRAPAFEWLKKHCLLYQGDAEALKGKDAPVAGLDLVLDAVTLPQVLQMDDLLPLAVVQELGKSKEKKPLLELMEIFMDKGMEELLAFHKKNPKLFDEHKISLEDATSKMRLLTLATLAQGNQELSLADVAVALKENEDTAEKWVVRAISEGVIDGRIDQTRKQVLVKSSLPRKFGKKEWQFLGAKLDSWINNIDNLLVLVRQQEALGQVGGA